MNEDVRVTTKIDVPGLDEIVNKLGRMTGSILETQRAMRQVGTIGEEALRSGGTITPQHMESLTRNVDFLKRAESEINRMIVERKAEFTSMLSKSPELTKLFQNYEKFGLRPSEIGAAMNTVSGKMFGFSDEEWAKMKASVKDIPDLEGRSGRLGQQIPVAEALSQAVKAGTEEGVDRGLDKASRRMGGLLRTGLGLLGIGSALGVLAESRSRGREFYTASSDMAVNAGVSSKELEAAALTGGGAFGLSPMQRLQIIRSLRGGFGLTPGSGTQDRFAGLGMAFGGDREFFSRMAGEMSLTSFTPDATGLAQSERFGMNALGLSRGMTPAQRQMFVESNKNLVEQLTQMYGGRPLNVDDYFKGVSAMLLSVKDLGLAGGGVGLVRDVSAGVISSVSPMGRSPADIMKLGAMMGIDMGEAAKSPGGLFFGTTSKILEKLSGPGGTIGAIQSMAKFAGIQTGPGAQISSDDMTKLYPIVHSMLGADAAKALQQSNNAGALRKFLTAGAGGAGLDEGGQKWLEKLTSIFKESVGGDVISADAKFITDELKNISKPILELEAFLKDALGPTGMIVTALIATSLIQATPTGLLLVGGLGALKWGLDKTKGQVEALAGVRKLEEKGDKPTYGDYFQSLTGPPEAQEFDYETLKGMVDRNVEKKRKEMGAAIDKSAAQGVEYPTTSDFAKKIDELIAALKVLPPAIGEHVKDKFPYAVPPAVRAVPNRQPGDNK